MNQVNSFVLLICIQFYVLELEVSIECFHLMKMLNGTSKVVLVDLNVWIKMMNFNKKLQNVP